MMLTTGGVTEAVYGSLMRIQRGWDYRYQYRVIVGIEIPHRNLQLKWDWMSAAPQTQ